MGQNQMILSDNLIQYPRGILDYSFTGASPSVQWKLTGNLGGEDVRRATITVANLFANQDRSTSTPILFAVR